MAEHIPMMLKIVYMVMALVAVLSTCYVLYYCTRFTIKTLKPSAEGVIVWEVILLILVSSSWFN